MTTQFDKKSYFPPATQLQLDAVQLAAEDRMARLRWLAEILPTSEGYELRIRQDAAREILLLIGDLE